MINTGDERNITGHFVSGAVFSAIFSSAMNYNKYKKSEITKKEMIQDTAKLTIQGGLGTASAIATANYIGKGNYVGALTALSLGAMSLYATEKAYEMYDGAGRRGKRPGTKAKVEATEATKNPDTTQKPTMKKPAAKKPAAKHPVAKKTTEKAKEDGK